MAFDFPPLFSPTMPLTPFVNGVSTTRRLRKFLTTSLDICMMARVPMNPIGRILLTYLPFVAPFFTVCFRGDFFLEGNDLSVVRGDGCRRGERNWFNAVSNALI